MSISWYESVAEGNELVSDSGMQLAWWPLRSFRRAVRPPSRSLGLSSTGGCAAGKDL